MKPSLGISILDKSFETQSNHLAKKLGLPIVDQGKSDKDYILFYKDNSLMIQKQSGLRQSPIFVDFVGGELGFKKKKGFGRHQLIGKAIGLKKKPWRVLDGTAGWGEDAFIFCGMGCEVIAAESSLVLFELLMDGYNRAIMKPVLGDWLQKRLKFISSDFMSFLKQMSSPPDVLYLDPMFPDKKGSSLPSKKMQILQDLVGVNQGDEDWVRESLRYVQDRVVVKRPLKVPPLCDGVTHSFKGKTVRYDMYLSKNGDHL